MKKLIELMTFLRLIDALAGQLSLTNVAVIVALTKMCLVPSSTPMDAGALFIAVANYAYKKHVNKDAAEPDVSVDQIADLSKKLEETESRVSALSMAAGIKKVQP